MPSKIRLVIFDLDGTLTPVDSIWRYLHKALGTWEHGKVAAEKYRRGEISYQAWAETDAGYWAGIPVSKIRQILDGIPYRKGAREVFGSLRQNGIRTAIVSAGLSLLADRAGAELGADRVVSNELNINDGSLTGGITVKVPVNSKAKLAEEIAQEFGIGLRQVALVGDRGNDLLHPECYKIAFKPKDDDARRYAHVVVEDDDLSRILTYIGSVKSSGHGFDFSPRHVLSG